LFTDHAEMQVAPETVLKGREAIRAGLEQKLV